MSATGLRSQSGAAIQAGARPGNYYSQERADVAALIPAACRRLLEVGCAEGGLGRLLRERGHRVIGVELVPEAAEQARRWLDQVVTADVEAEGFPFAPRSFDGVIFADVLEHLVDPWRVLRDAVRLLAPGGIVVASIPNLQNFDVLWRLNRGHWRYRERGITEWGHLRFFTLETIRDLFAQAGLRIEHIGHRYRRSPWRSFLCFATRGRVRAFLTRQYLVVGVRSEK